MIPDYSSHAAIERTFLAWVRTGVAIFALGFVIEKFDIFLVIAAETLSPQAAQELHLRASTARSPATAALRSYAAVLR